MSASPRRRVPSRVAIDPHHRRFETERLLDRVRDQRSVARDRRPQAGLGEEVCEQVGRHPFGRLDPAEQQHAGVGHDLVDVQRRPCAGEDTLAGIDGHRDVVRECRHRRIAIGR